MDESVSGALIIAGIIFFMISFIFVVVEGNWWLEARTCRDRCNPYSGIYEYSTPESTVRTCICDWNHNSSGSSGLL